MRIARTWSGAPARREEVAAICLVGEADHLRIEVDAPFHGDPAPPGPPGPTGGLWGWEVVELFVVGSPACGGAIPYTEVELSPHGHHLVLRLLGVRQVIAEGLPLGYQVHIEGGRWRGVARLARSLLPPGPHRANAFAIHGVGDERRHLAWVPVPGSAPDFHRLHHFPHVELP